MKIIESSIIGKKSPEACEDGMVVTDNFIAVIDGSTSKTPKHLNPDMKNGRYAMMLISEYIREEINGIQFELNSILVEKWEGKCYRLVIQRQKRMDGQSDVSVL